jgi:hypothetical protein
MLTITPSRPMEPTISLGRSNPAAFLTTFPPPVISRPVPSTNCTPMMKSRTPPCRKALGPEVPAATTPPRVAPARARGGSKGRYWPCSASASETSATGVPARAVKVSSAGS